MIQYTGLSVLQLPEGVEWNSGEIVYLVVGIAARSDEHIDVLAKLTDVLEDEATVMRLATPIWSEIIAALDPSRPAEPPRRGPSAAAMMGSGLRADVEVTGGTGLHARPASVFVSLAKQFRSDVRVYHDGKTANGKSMVSMLRLGVERGGIITITADGPDAAKPSKLSRTPLPKDWERRRSAPNSPSARNSLFRSFRKYRMSLADPWHRRRTRHRHRTGSPASQRPSGRHRAACRRCRAERSDLDHAIDRAGAELEETAPSAARRGGGSPHFPGSPGVLEDPDLIEAARFRIDHNNESAAFAWREAVEERANELAALSDPLLAARANDLRDVGARVMRLLVRTERRASSCPTTRSSWSRRI